MASQHKAFTLAIIAFLLSSFAWFFGTSLHPHWYLTWLAPLPILLVVPRLSRWSVFALAFAAFTIGELNMWSYDRLVIPLALTLLAIIGPSLFFVLSVSIYRTFLQRGHIIRAAFALPIVWSASEYLIEFGSPHSTFGNLAYTQMDCLPILQIVSITGIWSISFLVFLFPATVAALLSSPAARKTDDQSSSKPALALVTGILFAVVLGYGAYRLHTVPTSPTVTAGLIASDTPKTLSPSGQATVALAQAYANHIPDLVSRGAQVIILPEKIGRIHGADLDHADSIFEKAARENHVTIFVSYERQPNLHEAHLYSPDGQLEATYEKHHLLPAFESHLLAGTARVTVDRPSGKWGLAICKDMDFPLLSRQYAQDGAGLLLVPAWDFVADGWLHGRMAILRGVESGFSIARTPKQGILSLTDGRGHILAEESSATSAFSTLVASIPVRNEPTIYARTGDWFAWLNLMFVVLLFIPVRHKWRG